MENLVEYGFRRVDNRAQEHHIPAEETSAVCRGRLVGYSESPIADDVLTPAAIKPVHLEEKYQYSPMFNSHERPPRESRRGLVPPPLLGQNALGSSRTRQLDFYITSLRVVDPNPHNNMLQLLKVRILQLLPRHG